jgi:ribosomal protein S18 acetylase RimI-like enzyme
MTPSPDLSLPAVSIRPVELADADGLSKLCWTDRPLENITELLRRTRKLAANLRGMGVVALYNNLPCAFGMLTLWPRVAEISDLVVYAQYRGHGIGSQIINHLTEVARSMHVHTLEIGVALSNPRALALYRRLGFVDGRTLQLDLGGGPELVLYLYKTLA